MSMNSPCHDVCGEAEKDHRADFYGKKLRAAPGEWARYDAAPPWTASDSLFAMCAPRPALCETLVCARGAQSEQRLGCACRMHPTAASAASQWQYSAIGNDQSGTGSPSVGIAFRPSSPIYFPPSAFVARSICAWPEGITAPGAPRSSASRRTHASGQATFGHLPSEAGDLLRFVLNRGLPAAAAHHVLSCVA